MEVNEAFDICMVMYQEFVGNDLYYGAMATNFLVILDYTSAQMFIGNLCISYYPMDLMCHLD